MSVGLPRLISSGYEGGSWEVGGGRSGGVVGVRKERERGVGVGKEREGKGRGRGWVRGLGDLRMGFWVPVLRMGRRGG